MPCMKLYLASYKGPIKMIQNLSHLHKSDQTVKIPNSVKPHFDISLLYLPSMMARWRGVASSHWGFLLLMSILGFCKRMVTRFTLPLLAAAWRGVLPVSAGQFTSIGGFTWNKRKKISPAFNLNNFYCPDPIMLTKTL